MQPNSSAASEIEVPSAMVRSDRRMNDNLAQVARVLRRDMRRQANRESARRSRLCWQQGECAECAEIHARLQALRIENQFLKQSLQRLYEEWDRIVYSNILMKGELSKLVGQEKMPELDVFLRTPFK